MTDDRSARPPSIDDIDRVVHDPARFRILSCLFVVESADFLFLMRQLGLTQGNLSSHMTRLESAGYVHIDKAFENRRPKTLLRLTRAGRAAVEQYVGQMQQLLAGLPLPPASSPSDARRRKRTPALKPRLT